MRVANLGGGESKTHGNSQSQVGEHHGNKANEVWAASLLSGFCLLLASPYRFPALQALIEAFGFHFEDLGVW